jgi:hypothetical protein
MFVLRNSVNRKHVCFAKFSGLLRLKTFRLCFFFRGYIWTVLKKFLSLGTKIALKWGGIHMLHEIVRFFSLLEHHMVCIEWFYV